MELEKIYYELVQYEDAVRASKDIDLIESYFYWLGVTAAVRQGAEVYAWIEEYDEEITEIMGLIKEV